MTSTTSTVAVVKNPALGPFHDGREMGLAALLAVLAGATGAAAWLYTSGWYVTFMTGNSERMVLEHLKGNHALGISAATAVAAFLFGVGTATLARLYLWRKARHGATIMATSASFVAWLCDVLLPDDGPQIGAIPVLCLAFGLGALNTSISRRGEVVMPLSYVTGTLVKIGQGASLHLAGVTRWAWVPHLSTYIGFLAGAAAGGIAFSAIGTQDSLLALWIMAALIALGAWRLDHPRFLVHDER
jgi:uncharacterized membrane protein YoaK (UPF0700 family)